MENFKDKVIKVINGIILAVFLLFMFLLVAIGYYMFSGWMRYNINFI